LRYFTAAEISELTDQWLEAFGKNRNGVNSEAFLWHIFSSGRYPSEEKGHALAQYQQQLATEYIVLSNDGKTALTTDLRPNKADLFDYYVFPRNLAWTMAFTHEDGWLGPYFAKHLDYKRLNNDNVFQIKKRHEASIAQAKGWS